MSLSELERAAIEAAGLSWILPRLRGSGALWHRTSVESLAGILASGRIEPNKGQFKFSYPDSRNSYSMLFGAVSLFDFASEAIEEVLKWRDCWEEFLTDCGAATVLIEIERASLEPGRLRTADDICNSVRVDFPTGRGAPFVIPAVEVCHDGPIPARTFRGYVIAKRRLEDRTEVALEAPGEILAIAAEWAQGLALEMPEITPALVFAALGHEQERSDLMRRELVYRLAIGEKSERVAELRRAIGLRASGRLRKEADALRRAFAIEDR